MTTGAAYVARHEAVPHALLFIDADLEDSAVRTSALVAPVVSRRRRHDHRGAADQKTAGGGRGFVVGLARGGIERATGWTPPSRPSGALPDPGRPTTRRSRSRSAAGVLEVGLTIDVLRRGMAIEDMPCELHHRVTGSRSVERPAAPVQPVRGVLDTPALASAG